jgi:hypothetical protein
LISSSRVPAIHRRFNDLGRLVAPGRSGAYERLFGTGQKRWRRYNDDMPIESLTPKEQIRKVLDAQPDSSSYDELLRELAFARMVERGLADASAGRVASNDEVRRTIESWRR